MKNFMMNNLVVIIKIVLVVIGVTFCFVGRGIESDMGGVLMMVWGLIMVGLGLTVREDSEENGE